MNGLLWLRDKLRSTITEGQMGGGTDHRGYEKVSLAA
jgi:hypothetical protein